MDDIYKPHSWLFKELGFLHGQEKQETVLCFVIQGATNPSKSSKISGLILK